MTEDTAHIHGYYSPNDLYNKIIDGLHRLGKDLSKVTLDDLQPVDEFHIGGDSATKELIELAEEILSNVVARPFMITRPPPRHSPNFVRVECRRQT
jgi:hypothetical protein